MKDYLHTLQNVHQSIENLVVKSKNTSDIQQLTEPFLDSIEPCFEEIKQSSTKLKSLVEVCLQELEDISVVWENVEKSSNQPLEEIGKLGGFSYKIRDIIQQYKLSMIEELKSVWEKDFLKLNQKWFMNENGILKQQIGWNEKDSYIVGIKKNKSNQVKKIEKLIEDIFKSIQETINKIIDLNKFKLDLESLDKQTKNKHLSTVITAFEKLENSLSLTQSLKYRFEHIALIKLNPIIHKGWGDLTWEEVTISSSAYLKKLELVINEIFDDRLEITEIFMDSLIKAYNDLLEKQQCYQAETKEQKELKYQWLETQKYELSKIKQSLDDVLSSF